MSERVILSGGRKNLEFILFFLEGGGGVAVNLILLFRSAILAIDLL